MSLPPKVRIVVAGGPELKNQLAAYENEAIAAVASALTEHAADVLASADGALKGPGPLVPVDLGALRASGTYEPARVRGNIVSTTVGYGGPSAPYAVIVHERVEEGINWTRPGSGPKFLENAVNFLTPYLAPRIRDAIRRRFK